MTSPNRHGASTVIRRKLFIFSSRITLNTREYTGQNRARRLIYSIFTTNLQRGESRPAEDLLQAPERISGFIESQQTLASRDVSHKASDLWRTLRNDPNGRRRVAKLDDPASQFSDRHSLPASDVHRPADRAFQASLYQCIDHRADPNEVENFPFPEYGERLAGRCGIGE